MQTVEHSDRPEFWTGRYRGRNIAVLNRYGRWHVYLDHALQHNIIFATAEQAVAWLVDRIDEGVPSALH